VSDLARALTLCRELGDEAREVVMLVLAGYHHITLPQADFRQGERLARQALAIQQRIGIAAVNRAWHALVDERQYYQPYVLADLSSAYYLLADVGSLRNNYNQALFYYLEAAKEIERSGLHEELTYPYLWLGKTYFDIGRYDKCIGYFQKSLTVSHRKGEVVVVNGMIRWLSEALLKQGKPREALAVLEAYQRQNVPLPYEGKILLSLNVAQCYGALGQHDRAEQHYRAAIAGSKRTPNFSTEAFALYYAGQFYVATGQYRKADPLLKQLLAILRDKQMYLIDFKEVYLMCFKADSALANYPSAIRHYQRYSALKDSLFSEAKSKQIEQLTIQYETAQKEQALRLREKDVALLQQQNKVQRSGQHALLGGSVLLLALLGLGYNRYRLKQRSNRQLQAQQQQIQQQNGHLSAVLSEKDSLLEQKDALIAEKEGLLLDKDQLLTQQERLLEEKERLLREIHHRVKNNLQVVMSLLSSQAAALRDQAALEAIQESQHRVQAIALIHQKLYESEGLARIPMKSYIDDVVDYLQEAYSLSDNVRLVLSVEAFELDVMQAVPLGLIINEAISNAFKYAFPEGRSGTVRLTLGQPAENTCHLIIADDGVGLPAGYPPTRKRTLGMTLLHGFGRQLGGKLNIAGPPGTTISLVFREETLEPAPRPGRYGR
ncbi:MAG TPA: histidine kinase dimerization/phosphoacceptor domain -containing protein, partial [Cytophagales bacterium]